MSDDEKREAVGYTVKETKSLKANFNPAQPRVPAGNSEGGQWGDGGGGFDEARPSASFENIRRTRDGQIVAANFRRGRGGDFSNATPGQQARFAGARALADSAIQRVRQIDPNFKPSASLRATDSIEGAITEAEAHTRQAETRLNEISQAPLRDILAPQGNLVGARAGRAGKNIRTIAEGEFEFLLNKLRIGSSEIKPPNKYPGLWYHRSDGTVIGIRQGSTSGTTIDVIKGNSYIPNKTKVHKK